MNSSNQGNSQGNSQGSSQDNQQAAPAGGMQGGEQLEQDLDLADAEVAFGEVRRAERVRQQRLNRVRGQSER